MDEPNGLSQPNKEKKIPSQQLSRTHSLSPMLLHPESQIHALAWSQHNMYMYVLDSETTVLERGGFFTFKKNIPRIGVNVWWDREKGRGGGSRVEDHWILGISGSVILFFRLVGSWGGELEVFGLVFGLVLGPVLGLVRGLVRGLVLGLVRGLVLGPVRGLVRGLVLGPVLGLVLDMKTKDEELIPELTHHKGMFDAREPKKEKEKKSGIWLKRNKDGRN
jgi:hypothetical protein